MRLLVRVLVAFIGGVMGFTVLLMLLGHLWFVALGLGLIWSLCAQFVVWGLASIFWPGATGRLQASVRRSFPAPLVDVGRRLDRSAGIEIENAERSVGRIRLLGAVAAFVMLAVAIGASWVVLGLIDR